MTNQLNDAHIIIHNDVVYDLLYDEEFNLNVEEFNKKLKHEQYEQEEHREYIEHEMYIAEMRVPDSDEDDRWGGEPYDQSW
jgi:hypothetical protein